MYDEIVVVRSKTDDDAVARLQSGAVLRGLREVTETPARLVSPHDSDAIDGIPSNACILFHYDDAFAASAIRQLKASRPNLTVGCFGSDIYDFDGYLGVQDVVSFYLACTHLHRRVLLLQLHRPVYLLPEGIDSATVLPANKPADFPDKVSTRLMWFGYPESFEKGMASLAGVIKSQVERRVVEGFTLIVGTKDFVNRFRIPFIPYKKESFALDAAAFDYCVLSHFPLDLSMNSYIKSPNKLIAALVLGLIPLASRTPAYEEILVEFGLERFLFESPVDLHRLLGRLDPVEDSRAIRDSGILPELRRRYSDLSIARLFLEILAEYQLRDATRDLAIAPDRPRPVQKRVELQLGQHLRDLLPSIARALWFRVRRLRSKDRLEA